MNLRQLRFLVAIADTGLNISRAAELLHTSQPGVSKQIRDLEHELQLEIFIRHGHRLVSVTEPGQAILAVARRMLRDAESIRSVGSQYSSRTVGSLVVGTTHIYARYVLLDLVAAYKREFPQVQLTLRQGNPAQIAEWVVSGEADIGIAAEPSHAYADLVLLPGFRLERSILMHREHPLLARTPLTLAAIAEYPLVMLDVSYVGGLSVIRVFDEAGLKPEIVLRATDADVVKAYVAKGLGIGILPTIAFDPGVDRGIRAIDATPWFVPTVAHIELRRFGYLRPYMYDFLRLLSPALTRDTVDGSMRALHNGSI